MSKFTGCEKHNIKREPTCRTCFHIAQLEAEMVHLRNALRAAHLHLLVRPHMRMPEAEANVKETIRIALCIETSHDVGASHG
jgi:hypothetical protein